MLGLSLLHGLSVLRLLVDTLGIGGCAWICFDLLTLWLLFAGRVGLLWLVGCSGFLFISLG